LKQIKIWTKDFAMQFGSLHTRKLYIILGSKFGCREIQILIIHKHFMTSRFLDHHGGKSCSKILLSMSFTPSKA